MRNRRDIAVGVIFVGVRVFSTVLICLHHTGLGTVRAREIRESDGVRCGEAIGAVCARSRGVVRVGDRLAARCRRHGAVVRIIGVLGRPVTARRSLIQLREVVVQVVVVAVFAAIRGARADETSRQVVEEGGRHAPRDIDQTLEVSFSVVGIGVHRCASERNADYAVHVVIRIVDGQAVAVDGIGQKSARVVVGVCRKRGAVDVSARGVAEGIVADLS